MFRVILCSSSGGQIVLLQHLVSSLSVSSHSVHRLRADWSPWWRPATDHLTHDTTHYSHSMYTTPGVITVFHVIDIQTVSFITAPSTASLWHSKPASAATFIDSRSANHCEERRSLNSSVWTCVLWWRPSDRGCSTEVRSQPVH
jgi:hypothetical protein